MSTEKVATDVAVERSDLSSQESRMGYDTKATKRLLRKIDWHLIPFLALLYLLSFLDRSNIGNARLANLEKDLGMSGLQYNTALAIFFPFYVAAEVPSNMMMKATRPSLWIPFIMVLWGIMCVVMGFVKNFAGLLAARSALGIAEGGLFPGVTFYITMWYARHECGFRMALFFSAATAAGAFGGLIAFGISKGMKHVGGLGPWSWIFILEGLATFIVAIIAFMVLHDYPHTAKFLTQDEKDEVKRRLESDRTHLADEFHMSYFWQAIKDWKIWVHCIITIGIFTPLYSFSLFLPTIIKNLGYKDEKAQLMTVPPYAVACVFCIFFGWMADKHRQRGLYVIGCNTIATIGFAMLLGAHSDKVKYLGTFFAACGIYPNVPQITAWTGNNIGGTTKRGVGMAMQVGIGNLGGVMSAFMFLPKDAPRFKPGHAILIGLLSMASLISAVMTIYYRRENARRDAAHKHPGDYSEDEKSAERAAGDDATYFRFTV